MDDSRITPPPAGTEAARFEAIFRAHHRAVLGYALRRADPDTAQEVVADTFLGCWRRPDEGPADPLPGCTASPGAAWRTAAASRALGCSRAAALRHRGRA